LRTTFDEVELRQAGTDFVLNTCADVSLAHNVGALTPCLYGSSS
jgi:hypothetical protein